MQKRKVEVVVISDVHLGTYGSRADELHQYLKSVTPDILVINGDFIDIWHMNKNYFPDSHWKVIRRIIKLMTNGTKVYYLTGNHDEMLRKFSGIQLENLVLDDKLVLTLDGKKHWFFHGDIFDVTVQHSKWIARLGGVGYDLLLRINKVANRFLQSMGREKISLSKRVMESVNKAVKLVNDFETTAAHIAINNNYDYVVCGHIHEPSIREVTNHYGSVTYLNSGDWIENLTSLEYNAGAWQLVNYHELSFEEETEMETDSAHHSSAMQEMQAAFMLHKQLLANAG
jgi:UDP-2,3-diacylglucosamine pyrophosphatase LpxH